ncbi:Re/Si-specific NAD(P)(+) transhydrogenase subunit alpha [Anaeromyxobacter paludicola]|uniref:proton-translocating NAD(P)(+) transhydrogenase n=1 Tax=Anaeromyxobacter paludicola TaxID=2918171 RepID=A0ABN6NA62_9BACT|nr:Re/Si-specific NAD(P)(+) transhydrogenase subunit alpha [Anaeromyxobacter paludicola]BDG08818.1 NAD(P) transhydrogenase subunit alpha [Anaeromyxobacter paludicola]
MRIAVVRETAPGERRVAVVPEVVTRLARLKLEVAVERGAGLSAGFPDEAYAAAGAMLAAGPAEALAGAALWLKVQPPRPEEAEPLAEGATLVSFLPAAARPGLLPVLSRRRASALAMELVPRITRAQSMDALSSQATLAGYKAVLLGASAMGKILPMLTTAAGTLAPAKAFILGAGVAGLQAIATARRLGAVVSAFDVRPAVKEQVQSLGATFVAAAQVQAEGQGGYARELAEEQQRLVLEAVGKHVVDQDLVITTAQVPGRPAPRLLTRDMVRAMRPGAVIVDLAAESGGNCELTRAGETVQEAGVTVLGPLNLPATLPLHASQMYARNLLALAQHLVRDGALALDVADEITGAMAVVHQGEVRKP